MTRYIKIQSLPLFFFAHTFNAKTYENYIMPEKDFIEITYISKGSLSIEKEGRFFILKENDFIFNLHGTPLKIAAENYHEHKTICFKGKFEHISYYRDTYYTIPFLLNNIKERGDLHTLVDNIIKAGCFSPDDTAYLSGLFLQLISKVSNYATNKTKHINYYTYIKKAKQFIYKHLDKQITQADIASYLNITPQYLCSIFKKTEGKTIIRYINELKLEKIANLMHFKGIKLKDACELTGYKDANYVSRLYKSYYGINITNIKNLPKGSIKYDPRNL